MRQAYNSSPLSQRQIADRVGLDHNVLSRLGANLPAVDTVERLAHGLGVSSCWLAFGTHGGRVFQQRLGDEEPMLQGPATAPPDPLTCAGLGERLQAAREVREMSRRGLARAAQTSHTTIRALEEGRQFPRLDMAEKIAAALDVSPCWLCFGEGEGPSAPPSQGSKRGLLGALLWFLHLGPVAK